MLDTEPSNENDQNPQNEPAASENPDASGGGTTRTRRRRAASRPAGPPVVADPGADETGPVRAADAPADQAPAAKRTTRKRAAKKTAAAEAQAADAADAADVVDVAGTEAADETPPVKRATRRRASKKAVPAEPDAGSAAPDEQDTSPDAETASAGAPSVLFQPPEPSAAPPRRRRAAAKAAPAEDAAEEDELSGAAAEEGSTDGEDTGEAEGEGTGRRRRRGGRGRRGRGRGRDGAEGEEPGAEDDSEAAADDAGSTPGSEGGDGEEFAGESGTRRRRRRRRRGGGDADTDEAPSDDPPNTVTRVREPRKSSRSRGRDAGEDDDGVRSVKGSTRLEAKKQRRREGREAGRRRPPIITEAEFLARRESVDRVMVVRQNGERTQIAVLEDDILVEHYVSTASSSGLVGNVYLGKVQNVLPSMEAAFVDIGKGRNAVLYAGEVNWDAAGLEGQPRRIELALKSGDPVLVQVTKDPIGHKGARLTSQVSLAGRYLVLVPGSSMTGISRKLPDIERSRLKAILKKVVPEGAGVIVRTAAEGASEEELSRDVARLTAQWEDIEKKSAKGSSAPALLYGEPDMTIRVVRDIFNEDFTSLVVAGDDAWDMLEPYVSHVAPDLRDRMTRWTDEKDAFAAHRVDEQLTKALDRKVWLPSGGYLVIDRTEAMIVVDVNTGKFTGQGGNLEETVTKNNLEAAEEIVRQLRLRDLGGIIVIDFIDMVLESNRDLVLRRLTECLGRDRTKHQVAEVTSLGLVQMTRKRVGQGLHEAFTETCEACNGRGYHIHTEPQDSRGGSGERRSGGAKNGKGGGKGGNGGNGNGRSEGRARGAARGPSAPELEPEAVDASPVAVEDPVESPASAPDATDVSDVAGSTDVTDGVDGTPVEDAPAKPRRRRKAVSPVTTL